MWWQKMTTLCRTVISQLALVFVFSACSTQQPDSIPVGEQLSNKGYHIVKQVQHVKNYHLYNWISVDTSNVIINAGASRYYLVTFLPPCEALRHSQGLGFSTVNGMLTEKDRVMFDATPTKGEYCPIHKIYLLEKNSKT
jgi:hypothetical protein